MEKITDFFYSIWHFIRKYFIIKYKGVAIYRPLFWKLIFQHIFWGFDDSVTWDFYYHAAKWIYPRLLRFYDKIDEIGAVPTEYEEKMTAIYLGNGYEYDEHWHRLKDKKAEHEMHQDAINAWKEDVFKMCEAFRDIIQEDDDWEAWNENWEFYVKHAKGIYDTLKTDKEKKKYWDLMNLDRSWHPGIIFNEYDFSLRYRKEGLKLFAEHFQSLWW